MPMNLLEAVGLVLGVFVCVLVLGLFNHLRDQPDRQRRERPPE
jgi:hypothetical protein